MKKKLFVILLSTLALTGCRLDLGFISFDTSSTNKTESNQQNNSNQNTEQGQKDDQGSGKKDDNLDEYTATISCSDSDFSTAFSARVQFDNSSYSDNVSQLLTYFDSKLEYENLITSLVFSGYVQSLDYDDGLALCLGSSKNEGSMTWKSGVKIYKAEITVVNYYKSYSYTGNSGITIDNNAHFFLDSDDYSLELESGVTPTEQIVSKEYINGTDSFKISSDGGRVLIKQLKITWRG